MFDGDDLFGGGDQFGGDFGFNQSAEVRSFRAPVTILCGFLGSGKTTMVQHILRNREGLKIGVVVNDIAEANIDSAVLAFEDADGIVGLQNGCACCSGRDDLFTRLEQLVNSGGSRKLDQTWDRLVIECSGAAQPLGIAEELQAMTEAGHPLMKKAFLASIVCVVDASTFMRNYTDTQQADHGDDIWLSSLLIAQLECADTVVINKIDMLSEQELSQLVELVSNLNSNARRFEVVHGEVPLRELLPAQPLDIETMPYVPTLWSRHGIAIAGAKKHQHQHQHHCDEGCSEDHHHHHHSMIGSFVYSRKNNRFNRETLEQMLQEAMPVKEVRPSWTNQAFEGNEGGGFTGLLRSKGFFQLSEGDERYYWSHAGRQLCMSECPQARLHKGVELVFIGEDLAQDVIEAALDSCLV